MKKFKIERFVKDLSNHFQNISENEVHFVDLFFEKIYKMNTKEKDLRIGVMVPYNLFKNLDNFRESYEELFAHGERVGFEYKNIFFLPVPKPESLENKKWKPLLKFQKGKLFDIPNDVKLNIIPLDEVYQVE